MRQRKVTKAVARLGLSQSGVSHAMARLRVTFDDPLFNRIPHGVEPTPRALEIYRGIETLMDAAQKVFDSVEIFSPLELTRQFRIGLPEHLLSTFAADIVELCHRDAPSASIDFNLLYGPDALSAVQRGEIDLAIGCFDQPAAPGDHELLFSDEYVLAARRDHPQIQSPLTSEAFWRLTFVLVCRASDASGRVNPLNAALSNRALVAAVVPEYITALMVAATTNAVVIAPRNLAQHHADQLGLCCCRIPFHLPPIAVTAVRRSHLEPDPGVDWLLARVRRATAPKAPADAPPAGEGDDPLLFDHY
jgi:DNA-binding transcriptional LysR family regulator